MDTTGKSDWRSRFYRIVVVATTVATANLAILLWMPIVSGIVRAAILSHTMMVCLGLLILSSRYRKAFAALTIGAILMAITLLLRREATFDQAALREKIVSELQAHLGVPYVWGGENSRGIDCSGLPRNAFRAAALESSFFGANGQLAIASINLWWHDTSAEALGEGYRDFTTRLFKADSVISIDHSRILPGDFAITANGVHAICYLGNYRWIHASPDAGKVIQVDARDTDDHWFKVPVKIVRWAILEPG